MKILVATPFMSQHFDAGLFWVKALCNLDHSVILWDYRADPTRIVSVDGSVYDLAIVFKGESVDPRLLHSPKVCYWPDALERTPGIEETLRWYDKVFTPVRPTPDWMEWLPSGQDPAIHVDMKLVRNVDTIYVGTANSEYKIKTVEEIDPRWLFGNDWKRVNRWGDIIKPIYLHELVLTLNRAKILIDVHQSPNVGVNRKLFEMIACGFTLVDSVPGVEEIFPDIWDQFTYGSPEHARELIQYYLKQEKSKEELWEQQKKAIEPYTYENCARRLLECLRHVD